MVVIVFEGVVVNGIFVEDFELFCLNGIGGCKIDIDDLKFKTESLVNGFLENFVLNGFYIDILEVKNDSEVNVNSDDKMEFNSFIVEVILDFGVDIGNVELKDEKDGKDNKDVKEENFLRDSTLLSDVSFLIFGVLRSSIFIFF